MTNSGKQPNSACFSGVLRRIFCTGNLPTHPSETLNEPKFDLAKADGARAAEPGPGVVARLMGLSSLPDANWVPNHRAPGAVSRSKSVNFADYLLHFDSNQAHHRRVTSSASFREVPPLNPHNDFLVLYMKNVEIQSNLEEPKTHRFVEPKQGKEQSSKAKKKKKAIERNEFKISKLKDEPRREIGKNFSKNRKYKQSVPKNGGTVNSKSTQKKPVKQKEVAIETKLDKKKKTKKNIRHVGQKPEPESDPENSSPVSVLDIGGIDFSDERGIEKNGVKNREWDANAGGRSEGYGEVVERICRLAEEDIRGANWTVKKDSEFEALEELCMELERHVVNVLLVQTLDEFCVHVAS